MANWLRKLNVFVGETAVADENLRVKFQIFRNTLQTPNSAWIRIYNVNLQTLQTILDGARNKALCKIHAGYTDDVFGIIYSGAMTYAVSGNETNVDTYIDITCQDGGDFMSHTTVNKTFAAGATAEEKARYLAGVLIGKNTGIVMGDLSDFAIGKDPLPDAMFGNVLQYLRNIAHSDGQMFYIDNGVFKMHATDSIKFEGVIDLNPNTGLVGIPQVTPNGVIVTALISPTYSLRVKLKLDPTKINQLAMPATLNGQLATIGSNAILNASAGEYIIDSIEYRGDTRGDEWYAIMMAHGVGGSPARADFISDMAI